MPQGWYGDMIIHGGLTKNDALLAMIQYAGISGTSSRIILYPTRPEEPTVTEEMRWHQRGWLPSHTFAMQTNPQELPERFEWRGSKGEAVKDLGEVSFGWKLVRLGQDDEVVAAFTMAKLSRSLLKAAKFQFLGSGATGELGHTWAKMALATFLRIHQQNSQSS